MSQDERINLAVARINDRSIDVCQQKYVFERVACSITDANGTVRHYFLNVSDLFLRQQCQSRTFNAGEIVLQNRASSFFAQVYLHRLLYSSTSMTGQGHNCVRLSFDTVLSDLIDNWNENNCDYDQIVYFDGRCTISVTKYKQRRKMPLQQLRRQAQQIWNTICSSVASYIFCDTNDIAQIELLFVHAAVDRLFCNDDVVVQPVFDELAEESFIEALDHVRKRVCIRNESPDIGNLLFAEATKRREILNVV